MCDVVLFMIESQYLLLKLIVDWIWFECGLGVFLFFLVIFVLLQFEVFGEWGLLVSGGGVGVRFDWFEVLLFYLLLQVGQIDVMLMLCVVDEGYMGSVDYVEDVLD